jgi:hypothetical protein
MRTRVNNGWESTQGGIKVKKIVNIVAQFPILHAYGVGFDQFRSIPEQNRSKAIDYARYMLAFELDLEIDTAVRFFKILGIKKTQKKEFFVSSDYLKYLYSYWRKSGSGDAPKEMPIGVFAMAALILDTSVRVEERAKPNFYIAVSTLKRNRVEKYLKQTTGFEKWPEDQIIG